MEEYMLDEQTHSFIDNTIINIIEDLQYNSDDIHRIDWGYGQQDFQVKFWNNKDDIIEITVKGDEWLNIDITSKAGKYGLSYTYEKQFTTFLKENIEILRRNLIKWEECNNAETMDY